MLRVSRVLVLYVHIYGVVIGPDVTWYHVLILCSLGRGSNTYAVAWVGCIGGSMDTYSVLRPPYHTYSTYLPTYGDVIVEILDC